MVGQALHLKICGLTDSTQACAIAALGVQAIGVIGVPGTPRCVSSKKRREIYSRLESQSNVERVWVAADPADYELDDVLSGQGTPSVVQLHGQESEARCAELRAKHPSIRWWKALRLRDDADLEAIHRYTHQVDALLIDAWSSKQLGSWAGAEALGSWPGAAHGKLWAAGRELPMAGAARELQFK